MKKIVILISGRGSNLQAILAASLPCHIAAVISNRAEAAGLDVARQHGITTHTVPHRDYADRTAFDTALASAIDLYQPDYIILAGFMRILGSEFVKRYSGRLINIHPSLLPAYAGLNTHERALQDGLKIHGCTVHFVTPDLDHGPIIIQAAVAVLSSDTPQLLAERVLQQEHIIYPQAISWLCGGHVSLSSTGKVIYSQAERANGVMVSPNLE